MIRWTASPIDRLLDEVFVPNGDRGSFLPIDVHRNGNEVIVEANVPGFSPDEVDVSIEDDTLTISAKHEHDQGHGSKHGDRQNSNECMRHERYFGSLYRQVYLGRSVDADKAEAEFNDGVLRVTVPVQAEKQPKRVHVNGSAGSSSKVTSKPSRRGVT